MDGDCIRTLNKAVRFAQLSFYSENERTPYFSLQLLVCSLQPLIQSQQINLTRHKFGNQSWLFGR